jgi:stage V sporulation protein B
MAPLIPVMYIDGTVDAILKGTGHQVYSMNVNIADALTACLFAIFLIPRLGIWGYIISIYATEILNTTLSLIKMISVSKIKFGVFHGIVTPILCIIGATNLSKLIFYFIPIEPRGVVGLITQLILTVFLYIALLLITRAIGKDEWEFIYASVLSKKAYDRKFSLQSD